MDSTVSTIGIGAEKALRTHDELHLYHYDVIHCPVTFMYSGNSVGVEEILENCALPHLQSNAIAMGIKQEKVVCRNFDQERILIAAQLTLNARKWEWLMRWSVYEVKLSLFPDKTISYSDKNKMIKKPLFDVSSRLTWFF